MPPPPLRLLRAAGFDALSVDMTILGSTAAALDPIGEAVETGAILLAGAVPSVAPGQLRGRRCKTWADPMLQTWDRLGFPRQQLAASVVPTPTCGLAGADREWALRAMKLSRGTGPGAAGPPRRLVGRAVPRCSPGTHARCLCSGP